MNSDNNIITQKTTCYHCGDDNPTNDIRIEDKYFCCNGCKTVYELLNENNLCDYYQLDENPGISKKKDVVRNYDFLEDADIKKEIIDFTDGKTTTVTFLIPQMHCSSCIWILENLYKLDEGVLSSRVNFLKKKLVLKYSEEKTSLKQIVELLESIGYEPSLNLEGKEEDKKKSTTKRLYYKIGVAGFAFGNIMLLSFPEYLTSSGLGEAWIAYLFGAINIALALPVFFYSASEYYMSAYKGLRKGIVNIDVPITLGISVLFFRSLYEILTATGAGYFDSLSGLVLFLLIGKFFQNKTYDMLNFERNYKSYFPIAITIKKDNKETTIPVSKLEEGHRLVIRNNELIPADSILLNGDAHIDYSFVTGESEPVTKTSGDMIYAGGKQVGSVIEVETIKSVSQSYLTQLWNNEAFSKEKESPLDSIVNVVSKYFTFAVLAIATIAALFWLPQNFDLAVNAFTAVLIIACPCALALSTPFTLGNSLRIFGRNKLYLKNTNIIERLARVSTIVFDKTGTITESEGSKIEYEGEQLTQFDKSLIRSLVRNSSHPLSRRILTSLDGNVYNTVKDYKELPGQGIAGSVNGAYVVLGSEVFVTGKTNNDDNVNTNVHVSIDGEYKGCFTVLNHYREGLTEQIEELAERYDMRLISGDKDSERKNLKKIFPPKSELLFNQQPQEKLNYIKEIQNKGEKVLMIGDGLNDAGALMQSDVGVSISEDINNFSPACDGILESGSFSKLSEFIRFSVTSRNIIIASFILSFIYNFVGLSFAVQGTLSPLIAAVLMPLSSITVVVFTSLATNILAKRKGLL